ncbi:MAG: hypothetical protein LBQ80_00430 [Clostridium sp.]|nr:hypothetical protein [Clostridium sp.]
MKKSFRLLSTILAAVIVLTSVAVGFTAAAGIIDDLLNGERQALDTAVIAVEGDYTISGGVISYPAFDTATGTTGLGGYSRSIQLTADVTGKYADATDLAWAPAYEWTVTADAAVFGTAKAPEYTATYTSKTILIKTEPGVAYTVDLAVTDVDRDGSALSAVDTLGFTAPAAADAAYKAELKSLYNKAFASSALGYYDWAWKPFELARLNALEVLNNSYATEADVDNALSFLTDTFSVLNDDPDAQNDQNTPHDPSVKVDGFGKFWLMVWESIKYALWDLFLAKIFVK